MLAPKRMYTIRNNYEPVNGVILGTRLSKRLACTSPQAPVDSVMILLNPHTRLLLHILVHHRCMCMIGLNLTCRGSPSLWHLKVQSPETTMCKAFITPQPTLHIIGKLCPSKVSFIYVENGF